MRGIFVEKCGKLVERKEANAFMSDSESDDDEDEMIFFGGKMGTSTTID